nr:hypothetical protein CFP56_44768 [Quercus suber]
MLIFSFSVPQQYFHTNHKNIRMQPLQNIRHKVTTTPATELQKNIFLYKTPSEIQTFYSFPNLAGLVFLGRGREC